MPNDYIDRKLAEFIAEHEGREIDLTGAYGAQSPDLIAAYIQALLGDEWHFEYPYAVDLWEDRRGSMTPEFERIERHEQLRRGDMLVFDTVPGPGTVGIYTGSGGGQTVDVFTQNPGPATVQPLIVSGLGQRLLGAWRLTAGAECKALVTAYAERHGYSPTVQPLDDEAYRALQELPMPGTPSYGHVEIITAKQARHYRRQTWRRRVALVFGWLRGNR